MMPRRFAFRTQHHYGQHSEQKRWPTSPCYYKDSKSMHNHTKKDSCAHVATTWASDFVSVFTHSLTNILCCRLGTRRRELGALLVVNAKSNAMKGCQNAITASDYDSLVLIRNDQRTPKFRVSGTLHTANPHRLLTWKDLLCNLSTLLSMTRWQ